MRYRIITAEFMNKTRCYLLLRLLAVMTAIYCGSWTLAKADGGDDSASAVAVNIASPESQSSGDDIKVLAANGGSIYLQCSGTGGCPGGLTYAWNIQGSSASPGNTDTPGAVTFDQASPGEVYYISVTATDSNGNSDMDDMYVVIPALKIFTPNMDSDFANLDDSNRKVVVGEQINLQLYIPDDDFTSNATYYWDVPDDAIASYDPPGANPITYLEGSDLNADSTTFYEVNGGGAQGSNASIDCRLYEGDDEIDFDDYLHVERPEAPFTSNTPAIPTLTAVAVNPIRHTHLFSYTVGVLSYGPDYFNAGTVTQAPDFSGIFHWCQVIEKCQRVKNSGQSNSHTETWQNMLDNSFPFDDDEDSSSSAADEPSWMVMKHWSPYVQSNYFNLYYMFCPNISNSIYIPISKVRWGYNGRVEYDNTTHTFSLSDTDGTIISPSSEEADDEPNWTAVYTNGQKGTITSP